MDCKELVRVEVVEKAIIDSGNNRLLEQIFHCIYQLFHSDFIHFIVSRNPDLSADKSQVTEMAKEAFQEGLYNFYKKTKLKGLEPRAQLKTIITTFGWWQFMAIRKKNKSKLNHTISYDKIGKLNDEKQTAAAIIDATTYHELIWDETLKQFLNEDESKLYQAIRMLPKEKWQQVIMWRYFHNLDTKDIAAKMGVSKEDVENKLSKARKALKEILIEKLKFSK